MYVFVLLFWEHSQLTKYILRSIANIPNIFNSQNCSQNDQNMQVFFKCFFTWLWDRGELSIL